MSTMHPIFNNLENNTYPAEISLKIPGRLVSTKPANWVIAASRVLRSGSLVPVRVAIVSAMSYVTKLTLDINS